MTRGTLKQNRPPGRMVSLDGRTKVSDPFCGHCSAPAVVRDGRQIGVYVDDTTPERRHWIEVALEHHPSPEIVFVGIAPGERLDALEQLEPPPHLVRLREHLPWGYADGPGQPIYPWRDYGPVPDCHPGNGYILQYVWHGPYGHHPPNKTCIQTITRQARAHKPRWLFKV